MSGTFNPRAIPHLDHYDRIMTWMKPVFARIGPDKLAALQKDLMSRAAAAAKAGSDDGLTIRSILAEIGFFAVVSSMAEDIEAAGGTS